jgi:hypothetical protein
MQHVVSIQPSSALTLHDLHDDATCTTHSRVSTSLEVRLGNPNLTYFHVKQTVRSQCLSRTDLPLSVLWHNREPEACLVLGPKIRNYHGDFDAQITKPPTLILRLNQATRSPRLLVHGADHKRRHPTSWSSDHWVPNLYLTILSPLHQVSYSCLDPHYCPPYHTCHLHTTRQANMILCTKRIKIKPLKSPRFKFKTWQVNDSSQSKQDTDYLVSQSPPWSVH